jgi:hypothetical protein
MKTLERMSLNRAEFDKSFNRSRKLFKVIFAVALTTILLVWCVVGFSMYKAASLANAQDWSHGVKPVIEKIWCGSPGCMSSEAK